MRLQRGGRLVLGCLVTGLIASTAYGIPSASPVVYVDQAEFLSATGATLALDSELPDSGTSTTPYTNGSVTYIAGPKASLNFGAWTDVLPVDGSPPGFEIALNGPENLDVEMAAPVTAWGIEFADDPLNTGSTASVFVVTAFFTNHMAATVDEVASFQFSPHEYPAANFLGIWADTPFDRIEIRESSPANENEFFGKVYAGLALPEPPRAQRRTLLESYTGAWVGWATDGRVLGDQVVADNAGGVIRVEIHEGDAMQAPGNHASTFGFSFLPGAMIDRRIFDGESTELADRFDWQSYAQQQQAVTPALRIQLATFYDPALHQVVALADLTFEAQVIGDLRYNAFVIEKNVVGSGSGYDQQNFYDTTAGHPYEGAGSPIQGYDHPDVLRLAPFGELGAALELPPTVYRGRQTSVGFGIDLPQGLDPADLEVVFFVSLDDPPIGLREVLNAVVADVGYGGTTQYRIFDGDFEDGLASWD